MYYTYYVYIYRYIRMYMCVCKGIRNDPESDPRIRSS